MGAIKLIINITYYALRKICSRFHIDFPKDCDLVLPVSISSVLQCPQNHPVAAYVFFLVLRSLFLPFSNVFQNPVPTQHVTNPVILPSF